MCLEDKKSKNKVRAEVKFPLVLIHTPYGLNFFDKIAATRLARLYAKFNIYLMPLITALMIFLLIGGLMALFSSGLAREGVRDLGPRSNLLIPVINPYLPWTYGWLALVITIIVHEAGHGVVARVHNIKVESTGLLLLVFIPIGAFVNIEREELAKTPLKVKSAILTAGPMNNMILAAACLVSLYAIVSSLVVLPTTGTIPAKYGVQIMGVTDGSVAKSIGLTKGSIIQTIDGEKIQNSEHLRLVLKSHLGKSVYVSWKDTNSGVEVTRLAALPKSVTPSGGILGVAGLIDIYRDPTLVLDRYKNAFSANPLILVAPPTIAETTVPYSDLMAVKYTSSIFGPSYSIIANILFWLWFVNFNVGLFNALPIGPLDGGQLYNSLIEDRLKSRTKRIRNASMLLSAVMTAIVLISILLPWVFR
jgi:membrane-associated protease RseP (regulator of RpoE activity)